MKLQIFIRPVLGIIFAFIGFGIARQFLNIPDQGIKTGAYALTIIGSGAIGIYIVPIIGTWLRVWSTNFAQRVASEVISQLRIPKMPRMGRGNGKNKKPKEAIYDNPIIVDTSALIDGRFADVINTGFLSGTLVIPAFVLSELQHIADASDALRRGRGRRGLEILESLKKSKLVKTVVYKGEGLSSKTTDDKLVEAARIFKAKVVTTDFNLNKVATVTGIKILNVNDLVNALKTTLLPGERIEVKVIQEGKEKSQGVGYLSDGTMIVVENGASFIGKTVSAKVSRVLQTAAGRMIFVQVDKAEQKQSS